jgi:hypothetical protein
MLEASLYMLFGEAIQKNSLANNIFENAERITSRRAKAIAIIAFKITRNFTSIFKARFFGKK